jgi:hypothetical protein
VVVGVDPSFPEPYRISERHVQADLSGNNALERLRHASGSTSLCSDGQEDFMQPCSLNPVSFCDWRVHVMAVLPTRY